MLRQLRPISRESFVREAEITQSAACARRSRWRRMTAKTDEKKAAAKPEDQAKPQDLLEEDDEFEVRGGRA